MSDDRVTRGVDDFAAWAGLSRRTVYNLISDGRIRTKKIGRRRLVIVASYLELIDGKRPYHRSRKPSHKKDAPPRTTMHDNAQLLVPYKKLSVISMG